MKPNHITELADYVDVESWTLKAGPHGAEFHATITWPDDIEESTVEHAIGSDGWRIEESWNFDESGADIRKDVEPIVVAEVAGLLMAEER